MSANGKEEIDLQQYNPHDSATIADETGLRPAGMLLIPYFLSSTLVFTLAWEEWTRS